MTRNLKALGLALVAVFALSALVASSASAKQNKFTAAGGGTEHIIGEDIGEKDTFTVDDDAISCEDETYTGTLPAGTGVTELTVTPTYPATCETVGSGFEDVSVTPNDCDFVFYTKTEIATDEDNVGVYVKCPQGPPAQVIEIHHYSSHANKTDNKSSCTDTVGTQTATGSLIATSTTHANDIEIHGQVGVHLQTHGACSLGFTIGIEATFDASATVKASNGTRIHIG